MAQLAVYMNGYRVGTFSKATSGAHQFQYADESKELTVASTGYFTFANWLA